MNFEELQKVNRSLNPMNIKGKDYIPVNERVKAFRMLWPEGDIKVELISADDERVIMKATAYAYYRIVCGHEESLELGTDYAEEKRNASNINRVSALENCSTSAKGRVLGSIGIGIDTSMATYEEVTNAQLNQEGLKLASKPLKMGLVKTCEARGVDIDMLLSYVGFDRDTQPEGMTVEQYGKAMKYLNEEVK